MKKEKSKKEKMPFGFDDLTVLVCYLEDVRKLFLEDKQKAVNYFNNNVVLYDLNFSKDYINKVLNNRLPFLKKLFREYKAVKGAEEIDYSDYFTMQTKGFLWDIGW